MHIQGSKAILIAAFLSAVASSVAAQERSAANLPVLSTIKDIRALSQSDGERGYPVHIRATVTHFDENLVTTLIVHDGDLGQFVQPPPEAQMSAVGDWKMLKAGDLVEIEGYTIHGGFAPDVMPTRIRKIGRGVMPVAKSIAFSQMLTGRYDCDYVEVAGVIQRTWPAGSERSRVMYADVAIEDGLVRAAFWDSSAEDLSRFIDARVKLRGNIGTIFGNTGQLRGVSLFAGRIRDIVMLESPPDPFSLPERSIQKIYNYSSAGEVNRRIRVHGVVTARIAMPPIAMQDFTTRATFQYVVNALYLKDASGDVRIETEAPPHVQLGDIVEAAGFPAVTPGRPMLRNGVFRVVGNGTEPAPVNIELTNVLTPDHDAQLVRMNAQLLSVIPNPIERVLVLRAGDTVFEARLEATHDALRIDDIRAGSTLMLTGVYSYQSGPPPSFRLFLRTPRDVSVLRAAPWWTLRHTAVMVTILAFVAGVGAWRMRALTARKRREYQAVLNERSRVARELHDTVEQGLAGIALQLEAVDGSFKTAPEAARESLKVARQMLRYSLEETRRSVMDLRSQALERSDLAGALETLAHQMTLNTPAQASVHVSGPVQRLDAAREHHLLRIGLEALTNALKHGRATRIDIELSFRPDSTRLIVTDDGEGLESAERGSGGAHFGLQGVRERVDKLGGVLEIDSSPGAGTRLSVMIPALLESRSLSHAQLSEI
ncbi:MAG TPA: histidine kinase [Vicinamibacterales bacterium]|nr:histidine kinase [Vicinamibacterales bacterium]